MTDLSDKVAAVCLSSCEFLWSIFVALGTACLVPPAVIGFYILLRRSAWL